MPKGWDTWALWQYSEDGILEGVNTEIDLNIVNDSWFLAELELPNPPEPPIPIEGDNMLYIYLGKSTIEGMALRPRPDTGSAAFEYLPPGTPAIGNMLHTYDSDSGNGLKGDQWLHVTEVSGKPMDCWVAIVHRGRVYGTVALQNPENQNVVPDEIIVIIDGVEYAYIPKT